MNIPLSDDHALILFDLIARLNADESLQFEDQAEQRALWDLEAVLEGTLAVAFAPDYREQVARARDRVRDEAP